MTSESEAIFDRCFVRQQVDQSEIHETSDDFILKITVATRSSSLAGSDDWRRHCVQRSIPTRKDDITNKVMEQEEDG